MEKIDKYSEVIIIDGKNVTGDVSPYLSRISYTDRLEAESDDISLSFEDTQKLWQQSWYPQQGDSLQAKIGKPGDVLDCGTFEIDEIEFEGPPDTVTVKGIAAAINKELRTKNSKGFEKQSLRKIAQYFADKHGLQLIGDLSALQKIEIERKTQENQTDLSFLSGLAKEYGFIFSLRGGSLVFMDIETLESQAPAMIINRSDVARWNFRDKTSQVYAGASVSTRDMRSNTIKKWDIKPSATESKKDILIVGGRAENESQAQAKAKGALKSKNKEKITGSFSIEGKTSLVAGITVTLADFGNFSGKWLIETSTHNKDKSGGYTTDVSTYKIVEQ